MILAAPLVALILCAALPQTERSLVEERVGIVEHVTALDDDGKIYLRAMYFWVGEPAAATDAPAERPVHELGECYQPSPRLLDFRNWDNAAPVIFHQERCGVALEFDDEEFHCRRLVHADDYIETVCHYCDMPGLNDGEYWVGLARPKRPAPKSDATATSALRHVRRLMVR